MARRKMAAVPVRIPLTAEVRTDKAALNRLKEALHYELTALVRGGAAVASLTVRSRGRLANSGSASMKRLAGAFQTVPVVTSHGIVAGGAGQVSALDRATPFPKRTRGVPSAEDEEGRTMHFRKKEPGEAAPMPAGGWHGWWFNQEFGKNPERGPEIYQENPQAIPFGRLPADIINRIADGGRGTGMGIRPGRFIRNARWQAKLWVERHAPEILVRARSRAGL